MTETLLDSRYRVVRPLGSSRASDVMLVEDLLEGGQEVALKTLRGVGEDGRMDRATLERLRREFRLMTRLRHPNLARVLGFGRDEASGRTFFTMEYVRGRTLLEILQQDGPLAPERVVEVLVQLCRALSFVHSRGVLHNDVKPANLMLQDDVLKVLDFGLADAGPSRSRQAKGTLAYLAPEAVAGRVDVRSDLFAVGVTFVELLTGVPFHGTASPEEILNHLSYEDAFHEVRRAALERLPHIVLRRIAERLTEFDPDRRYDAAAHVLLDVRADLDAEIELETDATSRAYLHGPRLVGRDDLLRQLLGELETAPARARVTVLTGPLGIGKSRLLAEVLWTRQEDGARVLHTSALGAPGRAFGTIAQVVDAALLHAPDALVASHAAELVKILPQHPRLSATPPSPTLDARTERGVLVHQIAAFLGAFAVDQGHPVVVAVSEAESADAASLDALEELLGVDGMPEIQTGIRVILTFEDRAPRPAQLWIESMRSRGRVAETRLPPLGVPGVTTYLEAVFGKDAMEPSLREAAAELHAHAGGTPLVLEEILRVLLEDGTIHRGARGWGIRATLAESDLPDDPSGLVTRQLDASAPTPDERTALEILALLGRPARFDELRRMLDLDDESPLHAVLTGLESKDLVTVEHDERGPLHRLSTGLLRDVVLDRIASPGALHRALATRLEEIHGAEADDHAEELARHFDLGGDRDRARHYYALAADHAEARFAIRASLALLERLEQLTPESDAEARLDCRLRRAEALEALSAWDEGLRVAADAHGLAAKLEDEARAARAALILGSLRRAKGGLLAAHALFLEAQERSLRCGDQRGLARALGARGRVSVQLGHTDEAEECHERELGIAEGLGDEELIAVAIGQLGRLHLVQERLDEALACFQRQLEISRRRGDERTAAVALGNLGIVHRRLGAYEKAEEAYLAKRDVSRRIGDKHGLGVAYGNLAVLHWFRGELGRALEAGRIHLALAEELGDLPGIAAVCGNLGELYDALGNPDEAERAYDRSIGLAEKLGLRRCLALQAGNKAAMLLRQQRRGEALFHAEQALRAADEVDDREARALARRTLARLRVESGGSSELQARSLDEIREWLEEAEDDEIRARYHHLLHDLTGDVQHAVAALELFRLLENAAPRAEFRTTIEELEACLPSAYAGDMDDTAEFDTGEIALPVGVPSSEDPLRDLVEIGRKLSQNTTSSNLLAEIVDLCVRFTRADRGILMLPDGGGEMSIRVARARGGFDLPPDKRRHSRTVLRRVTATRTPVLVPNVVVDEHLARAGSVDRLELRSVMCLPLLAPRKLSRRAAKATGATPGTQPLIGVLYVDSCATADDAQWRGAQLDYVQALADHAAVALANARVYDHLDELVSKKTLDLESKLEALERSNQQLAAEIEHRKEAERRLRSAVEESQRAQASDAAFLASLLTELRAPLESAVGGRAAGHPALEAADVLEDIAQVESGRRTLRREKTDTRRLLDDVAAAVRPAPDALPLVAIDVIGPLPRRLDGDPERLRRALALLARRAGRVGPPGAARIEVRTQGRGNGAPRLRVDVIDGGPLRADRHDAADSDVLPEAETLACRVALRLADLLDVRTQVVPEPDGGTRIRLEVELGPAAGIEWSDEGASPITEVIPAAAGEHPLSGRRILLIDDSRLNQRLIAQFLRQAGAHVTVADDGRTGSEAAGDGSTPFDLILLDLDLPDVDAVTFARTLRHDGGARVILGLLAASSASPVDVPEGLDGIVGKPVRAPDVVRACVDALRDSPVAG